MALSPARPLVSLLIPAYNERYFPEALASACAQGYGALEIVVRDDSPGTAIEEAVRRTADSRVRYVRNSERLGFAANFTACLESAQGDLVKFLNDDDRLHPQCVEELAGALESDARINLATSRRFLIDEAGGRRPDIDATSPIALVSAVIPGRELGDFVLMNGVNVIGEPSTAMFRRSSLGPLEGGIFRWGGHDYHCLADLSLWLRLLARGPAYYCAVGLSEFRLHGGQDQHSGTVRLDCLFERLLIARQARAEGFLAAPHRWLAALGAARRFAAATDFTRVDASIAARVREHLREIDSEIARAQPVGD